MLPERSEEDVLAGVLRVRVDGAERELPVRRIRAARDWKRSLARNLVGGIGRIDVRTLADGGDVAAVFGDRVLELVVEYDETAALGGRDYLEEHATDQEIYAIFRGILDVSFPFARDLRTAVSELRALGFADLLAAGLAEAGDVPEEVGRSPSASSMPDASPSGGSVLVASTRS